MKTPKHPTIRVFGQRSIAPSFLNRRTNPSVDSGDNQTKKVEKCVSFSDFLDRKLNKSVLYKPNTEERPRPFAALVSPKDLAEPSHSFEIMKITKEKDKRGDVLGKAVLQQFKSKEKQISEEAEGDVLDTVSLDQLKQTSTDKMEHMAQCTIEIDEDILVKEESISRKRKDPFEGVEVKDRTRKPVLVLGDNIEVSNPMRKRRERPFIIISSSSSSKRHRPAYNHCKCQFQSLCTLLFESVSNLSNTNRLVQWTPDASGSGWWDCEMEGVDSEEVGYGEVWEGVGSTTFGDIVDWH